MTQTSHSKPADRLNDGLAFERPLLELEAKIEELRGLAQNTHLDLTGELVTLEQKLERKTTEVYGSLTAWERVNVARHAGLDAETALRAAIDRFTSRFGFVENVIVN